MKALSDAGIRVVAISVDKPEKTRVKMVQEAGYTGFARKVSQIARFSGKLSSFRAKPVDQIQWICGSVDLGFA